MRKRVLTIVWSTQHSLSQEVLRMKVPHCLLLLQELLVVVGQMVEVDVAIDAALGGGDADGVV